MIYYDLKRAGPTQASQGELLPGSIQLRAVRANCPVTDMENTLLVHLPAVTSLSRTQLVRGSLLVSGGGCSSELAQSVECRACAGDVGRMQGRMSDGCKLAPGHRVGCGGADDCAGVGRMLDGCRVGCWSGAGGQVAQLAAVGEASLSRDSRGSKSVECRASARVECRMRR